MSDNNAVDVIPITNTPPPQAKSYKVAVVADWFFIVASVAYLVGAIVALKEEYSDLEWIAICLGALGFVIVGGLELFNHQGMFHIFLLLAGFFALASTILQQVSTQQNASITLNFIANHLYLLEALKVLQVHFGLTHTWIRTLQFADFCFFLGALIDVILSYIYLLGKDNDDTNIILESTTPAQAELASAIFWVVSSILTTMVLYRVGKEGVKPPPAVQTELSKTATSA